MAFIAREDGEHFVIPSYRDALSSKNPGQLKKDIHLLGQSYGEYITMQKKGSMQYEVAFSADKGYLLGETVWAHFKKPSDLVYCEAIPGSMEVILVVVKDGGVYLDGSFPFENVSEELVVFLTQQASFEIYVNGDVPISKGPEEGKFSFDEKSVKSFSVLDQPVFPVLPLIADYKLDLIDNVLAKKGIGGLPIKQVVIVLVLVLGGYLAWTMMKPAEQAAQPVAQAENPYGPYKAAMNSPYPDKEVANFVHVLQRLLVIPGWRVTGIDYIRGAVTAPIVSQGGQVQALYDWSKQQGFTCSLGPTGYVLGVNVAVETVDRSNKIYPLEEVIAVMIDRMNHVYPHQMKIEPMEDKTVYFQSKITIPLDQFAPVFIKMIGEQLKGMPLVVDGIKGDLTNGRFKGSISMTALGS